MHRLFVGKVPIRQVDDFPEKVAAWNGTSGFTNDSWDEGFRERFKRQDLREVPNDSGSAGPAWIMTYGTPVLIFTEALTVSFKRPDHLPA